MPCKIRFAAQEAACHPRRHRVDDYSTIRLQTDGSTSFVQHSLRGISAYANKKNDCATREPERDYYVFMTALVDLLWAIRKEILVQQLAQWRFHFAGPSIRSRAECSTHTL